MPVAQHFRATYIPQKLVEIKSIAVKERLPDFYLRSGQKYTKKYQVRQLYLYIQVLLYSHSHRLF